MKRRYSIFLAVFLFCITLGPSLAAEESDYYYVSVPIIKVYANTNGYLVVYRVGSIYTAQAYLPMDWFFSGGKGEVDYGPGKMYPYMTVFYKAGKFSHVRLHLNSDTNDARWGIISDSDDLKKKFQETQEVKLQF